MDTLLSRIIRLAAADAELPPVLLTSLKEASSLSPRDEAVIESWWSHRPRKGDLLMADEVGLWLTVDGAKIPVAKWVARYKYTFAPGGFRLLDMIQDAVREWESYHPMVRPRIKDSPLTMMESRMASKREAFGQVTSRDELVIRRWWARKAMEGDLLFSDGETLSGIWGEVPTPIAVWQGWGTYKMIPTWDPKKKMIQSEVRKLAPGTNPYEPSRKMLDDAMHLASSDAGSLVLDIGNRIQLRVSGRDAANKVYNFVLREILGEPYLNLSPLRIIEGEGTFTLNSTAGPVLGEVNGASVRKVIHSLAHSGLANAWFSSIQTGDGDDITRRFASSRGMP